MFMVEGLQLPVIPFKDVPGSAGAVLFWHNGPNCVKVGVIWLVTTTSIDTGTAH